MVSKATLNRFNAAPCSIRVLRNDFLEHERKFNRKIDTKKKPKKTLAAQVIDYITVDALEPKGTPSHHLGAYSVPMPLPANMQETVYTILSLTGSEVVPQERRKLLLYFSHISLLHRKPLISTFA